MSHLSSINKSILQDLNLLVSILKRPLPRFVFWNKPAIHFYKLNSDDCSFGNSGMSGGGGLVRNEKGDIIVGYARSYGMRNNNCA